jgi:hypothetical protein
MKRHIAILAFGLILAGGVTYTQLPSNSAPSLSASSAASTVTTAKAAPVANLDTTKPVVLGSAAGGEND